ncbi:copper resistance CopC family protein [Aeromicrobium wangtongii]|uniref:Copper resistance protein CopC n=1 Tax=Aeromicrobium wangtongii TaxID=2969247 RepID=A0ABY5MB50_9ACTN|nr:copper resistance CopC family protein [Aeromicrobium wangtongii]MCD9197857.1 copper resistance protein CopC [Aeromicrobium wangtongii]UUP15338.1 copper resistance protein CopC [Aeromicrobium wangtongii]
MPSTLRGRSVLVVLLVAALSVMPTRGASAHAALTSSNPSAGSSVSSLPAEIELQFNDELSDLAPALILRHDGRTLAELQPRIDGTLLRADAPGLDLPDGAYQLVWRIVSVDGHPVSGSIAFRIGEAEAPATEAPATEEPATGPATSGSSTNQPTAIAVGLAVIALVAALLVRRLLKRSHIKEEQP